MQQDYRENIFLAGGIKYIFEDLRGERKMKKIAGYQSKKRFFSDLRAGSCEDILEINLAFVEAQFTNFTDISIKNGLTAKDFHSQVLVNFDDNINLGGTVT